MALLTSVAGAADSSSTTNAIDLSTNRIITLKSLTLEDLLHSDVTTVSKSPEDMFGAAAAVFVITGDDIRRSGALSIPEALELAPGLQVAQINQNSWAISARGFNAFNADKLLVMVDGRTVYSPVFDGVFWNTVNYPLEDIERIEVVRGPGGTLWGANAVNGVINIITKDAKDTQGGYVEAGGGSADPGFGTARYGTQISSNLFVRGYVQYHDSAAYPDGHDGSDLTQGGGRLDWDLPEAHVTLQGDYSVNDYDQREVVPNFTGPDYFPWSDGVRRVVDANVLGRYERTFSDESDLSLQVYYDSVDDRDAARYVHNETKIADVELQQRFPLPGGQSVTYGLGYRYMPSLLQNSALFTFSPNQREQQVSNGFIQDQFKFFDDQVHLILGTKLEHNDTTGYEVEPSGRLAWTPTERETLWCAVSRAVQVPGRANTDITSTPLTDAGPIPATAISPALAGANPFFAVFAGNPKLRSQELVEYELGERWQATDRLSFDISSFYGHYDDLFSAGPTTVVPSYTPGTPSELVNTFVNGGSADLAGVEAAFQWRLAENWRLQGSYSWLYEDRRPLASDAGGDAPNMATLRSSWDLPRNLELDVMGRFVDGLSFQNAITSATTLVDAYVTLDVRLGWRPTRNLEFAVVGQNLISSRQLQYNSLIVSTTEVTPVPRMIYATVTWRF